MSVVFEGMKTGAEIWEFVKHPLLKEEQYQKDRLYQVESANKKMKNGVISITSKLVLTEEELQAQSKQTEIETLKKWLADRRDADLTDYPDVQAEKAIKNARLLELLG